MLFRDVLHEEGDELQHGDSLFDIFVVFMTVVVESHGPRSGIILVNAFCGDDRAAEVAADVFRKGFHIGERGLGIDIEAIIMETIHSSFDLFEGRPDTFFQKIKEDSPERVSEISVVEVGDMTPRAVISNAAFREQTVDMGVPFKGTAEGVKDKDESGGKVHGMIHLVEEVQDDLADSLKETVKKGAVFLEEMPQFIGNRKDAVPVFTVDEHSRHGFGTFPCVKVAAGRTETGVAAEGDEMMTAAFRTAIHCPTKSRVSAVDHLEDVFDFDRTGMHGIYDLFIMVQEDFLKYVFHTPIMKEICAVVNQNPSRLRGWGVDASKTLFYAMRPGRSLRFAMSRKTVEIRLR